MRSRPSAVTAILVAALALAAAWLFSSPHGRRAIAAAAASDGGGGQSRLSDMGPPGDNDFDARQVAVAYNASADEYLVVWQGNDDAPPVDDGREIFAQRVDAATGREVGEDDVRISHLGPDDDPSIESVDPDIVWNATENEYLVVWRGNDGGSTIHGQRLDAAGQEIGPDDFTISEEPRSGDYNYRRPAVAWNSVNNEYLVVWEALIYGEFEILGQRLDRTGSEIGPSDFRVSDMGADGNPAFRAQRPAVMYNATSNEYLVVWEGDDDTPPLVNNEYEIFGQRIDGGTGVEVGANDFRVSHVGPDGDSEYVAMSPALTWNVTHNEYLVAWVGGDEEDDDDDSQGELEVYAQRLSGPTGDPVLDHLRVSDMGEDGDKSVDGRSPAVAYDAARDEYLIVWLGDDTVPPLVTDEEEIFAQRLDAATGQAVGENDLRVSDMGPPGSTTFDAGDPDVAYGSAGGGYLVVWHGDNDVNGEDEIWARSLGALGACCLPDGTCAELAEAGCAAAGGDYRGDLTLCLPGPSHPDCNGNAMPDSCEIAAGTVDDYNGNAVPDRCECLGDVDGSELVDLDDIDIVIDAWGTADARADATENGIVDVDDLVTVVLDWGPCPER